MLLNVREYKRIGRKENTLRAGIAGLEKELKGTTSGVVVQSKKAAIDKKEEARIRATPEDLCKSLCSSCINRATDAVRLLDRSQINHS